MKKLLTSVLLLCLCVSIVFANGAQEAATAASGSDESSLTVGVTYCLLSAPAVKVFANGARQAADELGINLIEVEANWDAQTQTDQMSSFIAQGVDAIVLNPVDATSIIPIVKKAYEAGIPVVMGAMDIGAGGKPYIASFVGADERDVGLAAGKLLWEHLGDGKFTAGIVEGVAGTDAQISRTAGFEEAIAGSGIEVIAKVPGDFDKAKAMTSTEDLLMKYPDIDAIWVHDDTMCVGVVQAIKSMGYKPSDIAVVSYNGSRTGAEMVKNGEIIGTAVQPLIEEGRNSVITAVKAAKGEPVEKWYKDIIVPITRDNVNGIDDSLLW